MYTTIGRVLRVTDASRYPLHAAVLWTLRLGDGRLVYRSPDGRIFQLEVSRDGRAGCISIGRGALQGAQCLRELARYTTARSGTIEIIQLNPRLVEVDFRAWPQSLIPGGVVEVQRVFGLAQQALQPPRQQPQLQQPAPTPRPIAPQPPTAPAAAPRPSVRPRAAVPPPGYEVSELFNPLAAAAIAVKGEELSAHVTGKSCGEAVADTLPAIPGRAYIVCKGRQGLLRVIVEKGRVSAYYEPGDGSPSLLGREAIEKASADEAVEAKVFIEKTQP